MKASQTTAATNTVLCESFGLLASKLNSADTNRAVAEAFRDVADRFFQWDSLNFDVYIPELDIVSKVMLVDVVDGKRIEVPRPYKTLTPSPMFREVTANGSRLILRKKDQNESVTLLPFGDQGRKSGSLMFVPIKNKERIYGIVSIQSYEYDAFTEQHLNWLEIMADQCCGALMRLSAEKEYRSVFENAVEGICRITPAGSFLTANRSLLQMLGHSDLRELLREVPDVREKLFVHPEVFCTLASTLEKHGVAENVETEFRQKNGAQLWVSLNAHVELDDNQCPSYFEITVEDITDRRRSQMELARTEALYRRAISGAGAVSYATNYNTGTYTFIDPGIEQLIGYSPSEMAPEVWRNIICKRIMLGEVAGLTTAEAAERVRKGELHHWRCDMLVKTRGGQERWISDASVQSMGPDGKPIGSVGILQDITDRKKSELMAQSFARLSHGLSMATSVHAAAEIIADVSKELFTWDACWVKLYSPEDDLLYRVISIDTVEGKQVKDDSRAAQKLSSLHVRVLNKGAELILRDQPTAILPDAIPFGDKSRPSASLMLVPIRYRDKAVGIMSAQSYTPRAYNEQNLETFQFMADQCGGALERIWADEALRKSELQFRLVWESSVDGMRLSNEEGTVLMVNEAYCRLVGKTKEELEGQPISVIHLEQNRQRVLEKHKSRFKTFQSEFRLEKQVTLWDGRNLWLELSNSKLESVGQRPLLLSIFRDISDRKHGEEELQTLNQQLISASRRAGMAEVASGVLHNVGNVLNSVNVAANVVSERLRNSRQANLSKLAQLLEQQSSNLAEFFTNDPRGKQLPDYIRKLADYLAEEQSGTVKELETLRKNIDHIKDIVAMQQSYAKVSGVVEPHAVQDLVEDALQMNAAALARHDINLQKYYEDAPVITTDKHKVLQILVNFIRNAKYACDEGGKPDKQMNVTVRTCEGEKVRIIISDNGVGIPPENLTRIFSHGFTTREGGHGFGLHSSALAAKELGGAILVHSDGLGKGATFTLELPFKLELK